MRTLSDHRVRLKLRGKDGSERTLSVEHVIAATGYKVDLNRLAFLEPALRAKIQTAERIAGAFLQFRILCAGPVFHRLGSCQQFWTGHAVRIRCRLYVAPLIGR